ncbi:NAD(P)H-dependent oxidoreductase [Ramlibacter sp. USB13]|uniref:NAD(P)H-dependent oxidoreductase n=1 Tax=Ramlibacter cellulosilyticus TaxID=2764187 RepID=A0A923MV87_9BURK|nr:NAD(P)H-dependent oxidoreductase [Ramlibacter cellulosilyticus]MBC5784804.1 NAD(P)H-dependent oxidoreductase [Ramlibacter cellulosilyticus]
MPDNEARPGAPRIYLIAAHPNWAESRVNRLLVEAARALPHVRVQDLYGTYPDFDIDVAAEQESAQAADMVVLLHPIQWYAMPALMKLWCDEVLGYGWAYGPGGTALNGKDLWLVASTGGPEASYHPQGYNRYFFDAFLPPYEQTATLCGMRFLPPLLLHGARRADPDEVRRHVDVFAQRLGSYPDWPELEELGACPVIDVPTSDRPLPNPNEAR